MALSSKPTRIDIYDRAPGGPVDVDVHYEVSTDNAEAIALGAQKRGVVVKCECPRASVVAMLANCRIIDSGGWPEGALPLPLPRK